jgi:hypothetical protein
VITEIDACVARLTAAADDVFATLDSLGDAFVAAWTAVNDIGECYETSHIASLQREIFYVLDSQPAFNSAGFVLADDTLGDRDRHLDWWHRTADGSYEMLLLNLDPGAVDFYDYYSMEWFDAAVSDRRRFVSGPLIDLPCADVYIMTFSAPMIVDHRLLGVAGADVAVSRFESQIMPPLRAIREPAVLVNSERRVIASNVARFTTGEKLPALPVEGDSWNVVQVVTDDLGWLLGVGPS